MSSVKEKARVIEWKHRWDTDAPLPHMITSEHRTFLAYLMPFAYPDWNGTNPKMVDQGSDQEFPLALVEFEGCIAHKFGVANDEVFHGLSLWRKGLEYYKAHIIDNSKWIAEVKQIHKVHDGFKENRWTDFKHYVLLFHDSLFECIAEGYRIETYRTTFANLLNRALKQLID